MIEQIFLHHKQQSLELRRESANDRIHKLELLRKVILDHQAEWIKALEEDFKKPAAETLATEIYPLSKEIDHFQKNLKLWMSPQRTPGSMTFFGTKSWTKFEPRGCCLIIAPWNYPLQLSLAPAIAALAAGNTVILKPSEHARHTSRLLHQMINKYFNNSHFTVIEGSTETTQELLKMPFDHIFFTGSTSVGKIVMKAASDHLATVTLELGGKSPAIVDSSAHIEQAAKTIAWGKILNAGQTCIAPDYVFIQESVKEEFLLALKKQITEVYGKTDAELQNNPDIARIISSQQFTRLKNMFDQAVQGGAQIVIGGHSNEDTHYFSPTVLDKVPLDSDILKEEIFGPILPIITYRELHEALHHINERPKPLALYIFSESRRAVKEITQSTSSGGVVINDVILHAGHPSLPFGGVGASGQGNYHGFYGFQTFSHEKAYLKRWGFSGLIQKFLYPPYTSKKLARLKSMVRWGL